MHAAISIGLHRAANGSVVARGDLAGTPFWCRWDGTTLWFVSSAASPVGEDDITIDLTVGEGVHAEVRSVAAMVVYAARGEGTRLTTRLHVGAGATLIWQPDPVIVTARAQHRSVLVADVGVGGTLLADDLVVLGRSAETAGAFVSSTELRHGGTPISLTSFDTGLPGWDGPGGTNGAKVVGTRILLEPDVLRAGARPPVDADTVVLHPDGGGTLATTLAATPDQARSRLDALLPPPGAGSTIRTPAVAPVPDRRVPLPVGGG